MQGKSSTYWEYIAKYKKTVNIQGVSRKCKEYVVPIGTVSINSIGKFQI